MKKMILLLVLAAVAILGLAACDQDDETAVNGVVAVVAEPTEQPLANADTAPATADTAETQPAEDASDVAETDADTATTSTANSGVRGPITILGNADFTPENGVVGGTGTQDDPYIIAAWQIAVPADQLYAVHIENVTAHFALRGLTITGATEYSGAAIRIGFAAGGAIEGCSIADSLHGIDIVSSTDISIDNCVLYVSGRGLRVQGESPEQYRHEIATTNLYNNLPIYYYYGLDGDTISGLRAAHLTVANSRNVTISNNEVVNGDGLQLAFVEDSEITLNVAHRTANVITSSGIHLYESHNNRVVGNGIKNNRLAGVQLTLSNGNTISDNEILVNDTGVYALASDNNVIGSNLLYGNVTGVMLLGGSTGNHVLGNTIGDENDNMTQGVSLEAAFSNTIEKNLIFGSEMGILFEAQASGNKALDNTITGGGYGIYMSGKTNSLERNLISQQSRGVLFPETFQKSVTQGNSFRGNVFSENGNHVYTNMDSTGNTFTENAFLNEGRSMVLDQGTNNVWTRSDRGNFWGFGSVTDADGDGIGDQPVAVYPSAVDDIAPLASIDARNLGLGILGTLELGTIKIQTAEGELVQVAAYMAEDSVERAAGFRGFPTELIAGFPGILFVFNAEIESSFTMATVPFDLDIVFFNVAGEWVGSATMVAQATALYTAGAPYQYALELPSGTLQELGIGSGSVLELP